MRHCIVLLSDKDKDTTAESKIIELSFGQSLLFVSYTQSLNALNNNALVIPTSSILLFSVFRPLKRMHVPLFINIPTESKQFLINGQLQNERANPTVGTGLEFKAFGLPVTKTTIVELDAAALGSMLMTKKSKLLFAPIGAVRCRIIQNNNFVMYIGSSYSFGIAAFGLIYGTGYVF